jgi:hypothetical protein
VLAGAEVPIDFEVQYLDTSSAWWLDGDFLLALLAAVAIERIE